MKDKVRVRFAPSPTGHLHVGGARTALFNYLYARRKGGEFVLRIEDTDRERSDEKMTEEIMASLRWMGLDWDGEPLRQSQRQERYNQVVMELLNSGAAYRCFCEPEELDAKRKRSQDENKRYMYDRTCRNLETGEVDAKLEAGARFAVRFAVPEGETSFDDLVYGSIRFNNQEIDDFIIARRDGTPTYQLAVVTDDSDTGVTHVCRGDDHLSNTPKQIMLLKALGREVPVYAHLPLILGPDGSRLSKRHGATSVEEFKERGILPDAFVNHLALLGWSPKDDTEFMAFDELVRRFKLSGVSKKSAVFDEKKLLWLNGRHIGAMPSGKLLEILAPRWGLVLDDPEDREYALNVINLIKGRGRTLDETVEYGQYFFDDPERYEEKGVRKRWRDRRVNEQVAGLSDRLESLETFGAEEIERALRGEAERLGVPAAGLIHPVRIAVSGFSVGPSLFEMMELLGKERVLRRLRRAVKVLPDAAELYA